MKVFISWSGDKSRKLAQALKDWLPSVIQAVTPYFSPDDLEKGSRWSSEISKELEEASVGIVCLTKTNLQAPWLMFEAGALAKTVERSRVVPLLFEVQPSDIKGPLVQFQATEFSKKDIKKLVKTINSALGDRQLTTVVLDKVFEKWWPEFERNVNSVLMETDQTDNSPHRTDRDILEELLEISRATFYEPSTNAIDLLLPIEKLGLPKETLYSLKSEAIHYIGDLVQRSEKELLGCQQIEQGSINEIKTSLSTYDLSLNMDLNSSF